MRVSAETRAKIDPTEMDAQLERLRTHFRNQDRVPDPLGSNRVPDPLATDRIPDPLANDRIPDPLAPDRIPHPLATDRVPDPLATDRIPDPLAGQRPALRIQSTNIIRGNFVCKFFRNCTVALDFYVDPPTIDECTIFVFI